MKYKKSIIICSYLEGSIQEAISFSNWDLDSTLVICADGGINLAYNEDIPVDHLVGDLDSINSSQLNLYLSKYPSLEIHTFPPEKDLTDTALAIEFAISKEVDEILIIGGMGGRIDHTLAIIQTIAYYAKSNIKCSLCNKNNFLYITNEKSFKLPILSGKYFSIFSFDQEINRVSINGGKYNISNHKIKNTFPLGVSNQFILGENVSIEKSEGSLIVIISKD